jgi:hypothetical protein
MTNMNASLAKSVVLTAILLALGSAKTTAGFTGERPFTATADGAIVELAPGVILFSEAGHATHLGKYQATGVFIATGVNPDGTINLLDFSTFYAADNAEEIYSFGTAVADLTTGAVSGTDILYGGTGRFEDATGIIEFDSVLTGPTTYHSVIEGTIDY